MWVILEVVIALTLTYFFYKNEKPKLKFLFLGYGFFLVALTLQLPLRVLEYYLNSTFNIPLIILIFLPIMAIIISELTKYFSLRRFLNTRSYKNGIFFGIGWATLESITITSTILYSFIFSLFNLEFNTAMLSNSTNAFLNFGFFFVFNIAVTVLIIIALIKKNYVYLLYAITLSLVSFVCLSVLSGFEKVSFSVLMFIYSLYIIFKYKTIK